MFPNIMAELGRHRMTIKDLSEQTDIKYDSLKNKLRGITEFRLVEMQKIKDIFPACSMDYLFESDGLIGEED